MNAIDTVIAALSPRWAASRLYWRTVGSLARGYDAAKTGRRTENWLTGGSSANAQIGPAQSRLRERSRDLARNNPYANKALRTLRAKTIGTGIRPRAADPGLTAAARRGIDDWWESFSDHCDPEGLTDFYGLQALVAQTVFESGEALVRLIARPSGWRLPVPLQIQVLEPDYLDASQSRLLADGGSIVQGIEFDAAGRRAAYWLFDGHPGDVGYRSGRLQARRVPAGEVFHVFDRMRPGQVRGVPVMAPVVMALRDLDDYDDAERMRKKVSAALAVFVRKVGAGASPLTGSSATIDAAGRRIETFAPGQVQYLGLDEEVQMTDPPAAEGYRDYMLVQLHAAAAGAGVTYEQMTGDLSGVNYSSIRAGLVDFWDLIDQLQWHVFVPQLCAPVWKRVDDLALLLGQRRDAVRAEWQPPKRRWVDPVKDVESTRDAMRSGLVTLRQAIAEQGADPDKQLAEIAETNALLDKLGLRLDGDGRHSGNGGAVKVVAPAAQQENGDGDD